jgi:hypothetical protein
MQGCPMASMCKEFAGAPQARWGPSVLGILFLLVGGLILVQPGFLVWLAGITTMVLGLLFFAGGVVMRRFVQKIECCQPS